MCIGVLFFAIGGFIFFFVGVMTFSLTMRTLCHLSVGMESYALVLFFMFFGGGFVLFWSTLISFTLAISLYMSVSAR